MRHELANSAIRGYTRRFLLYTPGKVCQGICGISNETSATSVFRGKAQDFQGLRRAPIVSLGYGLQSHPARLRGVSADDIIP